MDLQGLTLVSVPDHDRDMAARMLPGARLEPTPLATTRPDDTTRVLAVMIHDRVDTETLAGWNGLEAVVTRSDGHDHLPVDRLQADGIAAFHLGDYATASVVELALGMLVSLLHRVPEADGLTRSGRWDRSELVGRRISDVTVGLLGTGRIGGRLARVLRALDARVVAFDLEPDPGLQEGHGVRYVDDLHALCKQSDALSVHVPLTPETRHMLDAEALGCLPRGAVLVNTARGDIVDQDAVLEALETGRLAGYAADVLPGEPRPPHLARLAASKKVLLTPHLGAHTAGTLLRRYEVTQAIAAAVLGESGAGDPEVDVESLRLTQERVG